MPLLYNSNIFRLELETFKSVRRLFNKPATKTAVTKMSPVGQTCRIESYHRIVLSFAPKHLSFGYQAMVSRYKQISHVMIYTHKCYSWCEQYNKNYIDIAEMEKMWSVTSFFSNCCHILRFLFSLARSSYGIYSISNLQNAVHIVEFFGQKFCLLNLFALFPF